MEHGQYTHPTAYLSGIPRKKVHPDPGFEEGGFYGLDMTYRWRWREQAYENFVR